MTGLILARLSKWHSLSARGTLLLLLFVAVGVGVTAGLGFRELRSETEAHIGIRLDRATRSAAIAMARLLPGRFTVQRDGSGRPVAYQVATGAADEVLVPTLEFDAAVEEIGRINQGFVNFFRFDAASNEFERFATSMRGPNGEYVRSARFGATHPAFSALLAGQVFRGESPQQGRMRLAIITPIFGEDAQLVGALATDVGWSDDLWRAGVQLQERLLWWALLILTVVAALGAAAIILALRPLRVMARYANLVADHREVGPVPYLERRDEIGRLARGLSSVVDMRHRLETIAFTDDLTGQGNRARIELVLRERLDAIVRSGEPFLLIMLGLDRFSQVNGAFGQRTGDDLLMAVGKSLSKQLREGGVLGRLGGDEFAVIVPNVGDNRLAADEVRRVLAALDAPFALSNGTVHVSACAGVALLPRDGATPAEAIRNAGLALKAAKTQGRNHVQMHTSSLKDRALARMELDRELRQALAEGHLALHYQPQIRALDHSLYGVEALIRWPHATKGMISPLVFIPAAEESGLIVQIGEWVIEEACRQARQWLDAGFDFGRISVNVSPIQLWHPGFESIVSQTLGQYGLTPDMLCLEITENVFIDKNITEVGDVLRRLADIGVSLSLDDFGTGYSSLSYLQHLPFQQLKIDRSFVTGVDTQPRKHNLLAGIIALGHGLGMRIIAEGTETPAEALAIRMLGCDILQGYSYSRPVPALRIPVEVERIRAAGVPNNVMALRSA